MSFYGSTLSYPFRPDERGMLATVSDPVEIVAQSIRAIMRTIKYECLDLPEAGTEDLIFSIVDVYFAVRKAFDIVQQIRDYEPLAEGVRAEVLVNNDPFTGQRDYRVAIRIFFTVSGSNNAYNLTFPEWGLSKTPQLF
jgi:hypothetical protein